jgi:hypothetical protein
MKYLLIIGDGMADNPVPALDGKTPLEAASIPTIDRMAARGVLGSVRNCPEGFRPSFPSSAARPQRAIPAGHRWRPPPSAFRSPPVTPPSAAIW